ncbi:cysteine-rich CWC family protein [Pseudoduganella flava]|uniref:Cysteine-rich CWC family protein n=1 Tax=Pseudoduganella flava TaxID=871742 RepID=A0ABX6FV95_9BURK|nr:cysteine-rich CWC family protein [Pseudoduganella flava]QGZ40477.1 hypothetical protein GO485_16395 [Pseudoduganella flava]
MSTCTRCGATFHCALGDGNGAPDAEPCWCTALPPAVPVPVPGADEVQAEAVGCWCPACLRRHIDELERKKSDPSVSLP